MGWEVGMGLGRLGRLGSWAERSGKETCQAHPTPRTHTACATTQARIALHCSAMKEDITWQCGTMQPVQGRRLGLLVPELYPRPPLPTQSPVQVLTTVLQGACSPASVSQLVSGCGGINSCSESGPTPWRGCTNDNGAGRCWDRRGLYMCPAAVVFSRGRGRCWAGRGARGCRGPRSHFLPLAVRRPHQCCAVCAMHAVPLPLWSRGRHVARPL